MRRSAGHQIALAMGVACITLLITPSPPRAELKGREGLAEQARRNLARGEALYDAECAACHDAPDQSALPARARPSRDISRASDAWSPGPIQLWSAIARGPRDLDAPHSWSHLTERDQWSIAHFVRTRAGLTSQRDPEEVTALVSKMRSRGRCDDPIKDYVISWTERSDAAHIAAGHATWVSQCASCHGETGGGSPPRGKLPAAPALASPDTIWRQRTHALGIIRSITPETGLRGHGELSLSFQQQWELIAWMQAALIPESKRQELPEIPWRGYIQEQCSSASETIEHTSPSDEQLFSYDTWAANLPPSTYDHADVGARAAAARDYSTFCAGCHGEDGRGVGSNPPLARADWLRDQASSKQIEVILSGMRGPIKINKKSYDASMPGYASALDDVRVAGVLSHVRTSWGNTLDPISADEVTATRHLAGLAPNAPTPPGWGVPKRTLQGLLAAQTCGQCHSDKELEELARGDLSAFLAPLQAADRPTHPRSAVVLSERQLAALVTTLRDDSSVVTPAQIRGARQP